MTTTDPHTVLLDTFQLLLKSVLNEEGYGGPVFHEAKVDNKVIRYSHSDFGDVMVTLRDVDGETFYGGFQIGPDDQWSSFTSIDADLQEFADIAQRATEDNRWVDLLQRS